MTQEQYEWTLVIVKLTQLIEFETTRLRQCGEVGKSILLAVHGRHILDLILEQECFEEKDPYILM